MERVDAAVFMLFGQSNALGHNLPMREEDRILAPMKNVFGLSRKHNQSFANQALSWSGYTSFGMNLGEEQDHTYSVANCLARLWQSAIDEGVDLPDLYIVHIAIGAQGITQNNMWNPERKPKLIPGKLGTVDMSLYPFTRHVLSLLCSSFQEKGQTFEILGLHWRGGEQDALVTPDIRQLHLESLYRQMFRDFRNDIGTCAPIVLHKIVCEDAMMDLDPSGKFLEQMNYINQVFETLCETCENVRLFDVTKAPQYVSGVRGNGIFIAEDVVHFSEEVNWWVAQAIMDEYRMIQ